ncbi:MAG TPA: alpha/beta hydrolase family protein [Humisphaera sp.]|nr:alpha/beta hydrolase family protein [Humisphaera sp.]
MRTGRWIVIGLLLAGWGSCLFAADTDVTISRVFTAPAVSSDERLHVVHDLNHPTMFEPRYADKTKWEKRAGELREQIKVAEGLWPEPEHTPLNAVIHGKIERDGYTIEKVFFASLPGHYVSGNLYRPTGLTGKLPAVLCPHGHWAGGRLYEAPEAEVKKAMESGAEKTVESARYPLQARNAGLARLGCIVFAYDMIGYADSQAIRHGDGFTDREAALRLQSFMGLQTWNSVRCLDFLCSLPDVDPARIAVTGASGGGTQTLLIGAVDSRPAVAVPAVMVSEAMQGGCICENSPLLRVDTNNAEIAALFAPKPLAMTSANDWTREVMYKGFPEIRDIYKLYGAADNTIAWYRSFPHNYNQVNRELMYNFLNAHLKLGRGTPGETLTEKPFVPVAPNELRVYDTEHPRPADSVDSAGLRKRMTADSDRQLAALAKDRAEYRKIVGPALAAMIGDHLPAPNEIIVGDNRAPEPLGKDLAVSKGTIRREGRMSRVPFVAITPRDWDGTVVIWIHPNGKSSLFDHTGLPETNVRWLLEQKAAVLGIDPLLTGENRLPDPTSRPTSPKSAAHNYPGYHYGYNRSDMAEQAYDVLSAIAFARGWNRSKLIRLVAMGRSGPAALLALAAAGDAVERASIDLNHFDFNKDDQDPQHMLSGALKYGGIYGLLPLCNASRTLLWNSPGDKFLPATGSIDTIKIAKEELPLDLALETLWVN